MLHLHPELFKDHHLKYPIDDFNLPFQDYIALCKKIIRTTRVDLNNYDAEKIIDANSPFEFFPENEKNPKTGALLIHGLLDSPFIMQDIAKALQKTGILARGILLPGQGTTPGDLLNIKMETWLQTVRYGVASFKNTTVEKIHLIGFSTGGALALYGTLANLFNDANIQGLTLLSPAIKIRSYLDFTTPFYPFLFGKIWQRANWLHVEKEDDYTRYQSIPFNAGYQVYRLTQLIKKISRNKKISCPMQFILSLADTTVSAHASIQYFQKHLQPYNQLLLYANETHQEKNPNTIVRNAEYPELRIKHFSHICIPISPENSHYGKNGDYDAASHIADPNEQHIFYGPLNRLEMITHDLLLKARILIEKHQRLTFNPDFDFMMEQIKKFIVCS